MSEENEPISAKDESKDIWVKFWLICFWVGVAIFLNEIGLVGYAASQFVCPKEPVQVLAKVKASELEPDWRLKLDPNNAPHEKCSPPAGWTSCNLTGPDGRFIRLHKKDWSFWRFSASQSEIRYLTSNQVLLKRYYFDEAPPWLLNAFFGGVSSSTNWCTSSNLVLNQPDPFDQLIDSEK